VFSQVVSDKIRFREIKTNIANFIGRSIWGFLKKWKAKLQISEWVRVNEDDSSVAGALVSNPENKRGTINPFIVSICLGIWVITRLFLRACDILERVFFLDLLLTTLEFFTNCGFWSTEKTNLM
jgi:hypothetical protein